MKNVLTVTISIILIIILILSISIIFKKTTIDNEPNNHNLTCFIYKKGDPGLAFWVSGINDSDFSSKKSACEERDYCIWKELNGNSTCCYPNNEYLPWYQQLKDICSS